MPAGFLFTAPRSAVLKLESQTRHNIESGLRVVVGIIGICIYI